MPCDGQLMIYAGSSGPLRQRSDIQPSSGCGVILLHSKGCAGQQFSGGLILFCKGYTAGYGRVGQLPILVVGGVGGISLGCIGVIGCGSSFFDMMPDAAGSPPHKLFCCGAVEACPGASSRCIVSTRHHPQIPGPRGIGDMVCCRLGLDHPVIAAVIFRGDKLCVCTGDGLSAGVVQTGKLYRIVGSPGASLRQGSHVVPGAADPLLDGELHSGKSLAGDRIHLL